MAAMGANAVKARHRKNKIRQPCQLNLASDIVNHAWAEQLTLYRYSLNHLMKGTIFPASPIRKQQIKNDVLSSGRH